MQKIKDKFYYNESVVASRYVQGKRLLQNGIIVGSIYGTPYYIVQFGDGVQENVFCSDIRTAKVYEDAKDQG
jgi:hypothetical protein